MYKRQGLTRRRQEERKLFITPAKKEGWVKEDDHWRFYDNSGNYVRNDWHQDGEKWYWFNGAGFMAHDVWYQYKGSWYYLGSDGAMLKGLQTIKGKWYYLDQDGRMATEPVILTPDQDGALHYPCLLYTSSLPRNVKEKLIIQALTWYMHAGTPSVLSEFLGTVLMLSLIHIYDLPVAQAIRMMQAAEEQAKEEMRERRRSK